MTQTNGTIQQWDLVNAGNATDPAGDDQPGTGSADEYLPSDIAGSGGRGKQVFREGKRSPIFARIPRQHDGRAAVAIERGHDQTMNEED